MTGIVPPHPEHVRQSLIDHLVEAEPLVSYKNGMILISPADRGAAQVVDSLAEWLREADWGPIGGGHTMVPHYLANLLDGDT